MLCFAQNVNVFFAINAVNKSNALTNRKKTGTELKVQLLVKDELLLTRPVSYIKFTNR